MLTLQNKDNTAYSLKTNYEINDKLLEKEWLLTNCIGGYASSSILGCNTRRYHGLLTGPLNPPVNRVIGLANCMEMVVVDGRAYDLSTAEFNGLFNPNGYKYLKRFRKDVGVHFDFRIEDMKITKSVYLVRNKNIAAVSYTFKNFKRHAEFIIRPFVSLRDFHGIQKSYAPLYALKMDKGLLIKHNVPESCELYLKNTDMEFNIDEQWWYNFLYRIDKFRGQDFEEDLWSPGFYKAPICSNENIVLWANIDNADKSVEGLETSELSIDKVQKDWQKYNNQLINNSRTKDTLAQKLYIAADQFVTKSGQDINARSTILAGYPWFVDWGRDAFISLPGLLLCTGRYEDAKSVLVTFANSADEGMIPNRFDDRSGTAYFNSIDASLWFVNAAFEYLRVTQDQDTFVNELLPCILCIMD